MADQPARWSGSRWEASVSLLAGPRALLQDVIKIHLAPCRLLLLGITEETAEIASKVLRERFSAHLPTTWLAGRTFFLRVTSSGWEKTWRF